MKAAFDNEKCKLSPWLQGDNTFNPPEQEGRSLLIHAQPQEEQVGGRQRHRESSRATELLPHARVRLKAAGAAGAGAEHLAEGWAGRDWCKGEPEPCMPWGGRRSVSGLTSQQSLERLYLGCICPLPPS